MPTKIRSRKKTKSNTNKTPDKIADNTPDKITELKRKQLEHMRRLKPAAETPEGIESDIPLPKISNTRRAKWSVLFALKDGQSIKYNGGTKEIKRLANSIAAAIYGRKDHPLNFVVQSHPDGVRVWATSKTQSKVTHTYSTDPLA